MLISVISKTRGLIKCELLFKWLIPVPLKLMNFLGNYEFLKLPVITKLMSLRFCHNVLSGLPICEKSFKFAKIGQKGPLRVHGTIFLYAQ